MVYESAAATRRAARPALLCCSTRRPNIAPIPNLAEIASTGAGQGVQLLWSFRTSPRSRLR